MLLIAVAFVLALQAPAWMMDRAPNVVHRVHQGPFDGRTTVWLKLTPRADDPRVSPTTFVFIAEFDGKQPRSRPSVTLQIETDVRFYPLVQRTPTLRWTIDSNRPVDLLAAGEPTSLRYCCGDDAAIPVGATVALSAARLDRLSMATTVSGIAFGVPFSLDRAQLRAVDELRRQLLPQSL
jgi:hypothetical protein